MISSDTSGYTLNVLKKSIFVQFQGESYLASDGCNHCTCYKGVEACTLMMCVDDFFDAHKRQLNDQCKGHEDGKGGLN